MKNKNKCKMNKKNEANKENIGLFTLRHQISITVGMKWIANEWFAKLWNEAFIIVYLRWYRSKMSWDITVFTNSLYKRYEWTFEWMNEWMKIMSNPNDRMQL